MPFFSIIIPTFNRAHILKRAIDSIFSQSFIEYEIVIVDDGSTDNTQEVITAIKSDNLKYVLQQNKGVCAARNAGVAISNGSYLIFLDSDDTLKEEALQSYYQSIKIGRAHV